MCSGIGLLIGGAFLMIFLLALHNPTPWDLPVGVVAPSEVVEVLGSNDALDPRPADNAAEARQQVGDGDVVAAYLADGPDHQLLVAGAHGVIVTQTVTGLFTSVTAEAGGELQVQDVAPIAPEDPRGLSSFYLIFGITLGAFIFGQSSHTFGRHLSVVRKLAQTVPIK